MISGSRYFPKVIFFFSWPFFLRAIFSKNKKNRQEINLATQDIFLAFFSLIGQKKNKNCSPEKNDFLPLHQGAPHIELSELSYCSLSFAKGKYEIKIHQDNTISAKKKTWLAKKISWSFFFVVEKLKNHFFFIFQEIWRNFLGFSWPLFFFAPRVDLPYPPVPRLKIPIESRREIWYYLKN